MSDSPLIQHVSSCCMRLYEQCHTYNENQSVLLSNIIMHYILTSTTYFAQLQKQLTFDIFSFCNVGDSRHLQPLLSFTYSIVCRRQQALLIYFKSNIGISQKLKRHNYLCTLKASLVESPSKAFSFFKRQIDLTKICIATDSDHSYTSQLACCQHEPLLSLSAKSSSIL